MENMKINNIKFNKKLMNKIIAGGLSLTLIAGGVGYTLGRSSSKNSNSKNNNINNEKVIDKYLKEYTTKRSKLEQEIEELSKQKKELENSETFDLDDLIVAELTFNNKSNLFILDGNTINANLYQEYHHNFYAWFDENYDYHEPDYHNPDFIQFNKGESLIGYLTDGELDEIGKNNGEITTQELDKILKNIRGDYKEKLTKKKKASR